jgi:hypothetical protein
VNIFLLPAHDFRDLALPGQGAPGMAGRGITEGPLFRPLGKVGKVRDLRLTPKSLNGQGLRGPCGPRRGRLMVPIASGRVSSPAPGREGASVFKMRDVSRP